MKITFIARAGFQIAIRHIARGEPTGASFWTAGASAARPRFGQRRRWVRAGKNAGAAPLCERSPDDLEPVELILNPRPPKTAGYTMIDVIAILCILALLAALLLPSLTTARRKAQRISCNGNLKDINLSYLVWAGDHGNQFPFELSVTNGGTMEVADQAWRTYQVMSNVLSTPKVLLCPADQTRQWATDFTTDFPSNHISYFVGLDGDNTHPEGILSGDDNLAVGGIRVRSGRFTVNPNAPPSWTADRHVNYHNIGLADGSVRQASDIGLANAILNASNPTNQVRFVMP